jgi:hypothetical protein
MIDYYYYRYFQAGLAKNDYKFTIMPFGVYVEYRDGRFLDTGLVPLKLFPDKSKLNPKDINKIIRMAKNNKTGRLYSKKEFDNIKQQYETETGFKLK